MSSIAHRCVQVVVCLLIVLWTGCSSPKNLDLETRVFRVAISQISEHPSLDQEREGIILALEGAGFKRGVNLEIIYQNAQGSLVTSTQIAQKLVSQKPDVLVGISTPSAQSLKGAIGSRKIPLVFTAVTDPVASNLVSDLEHPQRGISGVRDYLGPDAQLDLIKRILPNLKRLGVIYNPGESNSGVLFEELVKSAPRYSVILIASTANRSGEVFSSAQSLVGRVDAIFIPNDNTAVSAIESIVQVGIRSKIPIFAGDIGSVMRGAIGGAGYDRRELGKLAGRQILQFLHKGFDVELPIVKTPRAEMLLNSNAADKMGLNLLHLGQLQDKENIRWVNTKEGSK